jgi:hypothetical protein
MANEMKDVADDLRAEITRAGERLRAVSESRATVSRGDGKWTRKEILGHLLDSAANNHQRFVRAQFADPFVWPGYEQNAWVAVHSYRSRPWLELVDLWAGLNTHVADVIEHIPQDRRATECRIGADGPVTLEWLAVDYVRHMRHHLAQILEG